MSYTMEDLERDVAKNYLKELSARDLAEIVWSLPAARRRKLLASLRSEELQNVHSQGEPMSKQTWICATCRKAFMRKKSLTAVECPRCHGACEFVEGAYWVPSPKQMQLWDAFVNNNRAANARNADRERAERERQEELAKLNAARPPKKAVVEEHVPYLEAICMPLIKTLNHSAGLPTNQLAGHAANLEFWVNEAQHCLAVIDGYWERLKRIRAAQAEYEKQQDGGDKSFPLRASIMDSWRQELRRRVPEAIERFLSRCDREKLVSKQALKAFWARLESRA